MDRPPIRRAKYPSPSLRKRVVTSFAQPLRSNVDAGAIYRHNSRPAYLLKRAEQTLTALYLQRCRSRGLRLTLSQLWLLNAIEAVPGAHQALAARLAGMDTPTTAVVMRSLIKQHFVDRETSRGDRRHLLLTLTKAGRAIKQVALDELSAATRDLLGPLRAAERRRLIELLTRVSGNASSAAPSLLSRDGHPSSAPDYLPPAVLPAFLISRCLQVAVSLVGPAVASAGLSIGQYVTLFFLSTLEEFNLARLCQALGAERSSLSHILRALQARSLITISQGGKRSRALNITATPAGIKLFAQVRPAAEAANSQILSNLNREEAQEFRSLLGKMLMQHGKLSMEATPVADLPLSRPQTG